MNMTRILIAAVSAIPASAIVTQADSITHAELITSAIEAVRFEPAFGETITPAQEAEIRADLAAWIQGFDFVPDVIEDVSAKVKAELLSRNLSLHSADPDYCRAQATAWAMAVVAGARMANHVPLLTSTQENDLSERAAILLDRVGLNIETHLGDVLPAKTVAEYSRRFSESVLRQTRNPLSDASKHVPAWEEIDRITKALEERIAKSAPEMRREWGRHVESGKPPAIFADYVLTQTFLPAVSDFTKASRLPDDVLERLRAEHCPPAWAEAQRRAAEFSMAIENEVQRRRRDAFEDRVGASQAEREAAMQSGPTERGALQRPSRKRTVVFELPTPTSRPAERTVSE